MQAFEIIENSCDVNARRDGTNEPMTACLINRLAEFNTVTKRYWRTTLRLKHYIWWVKENEE